MHKLNKMVQTVMTDNQWPEKQLEYWHPKDNYKGKQESAITPLNSAMTSIAMSQGEGVPLRDFVETCGSVALEGWVWDVTNAILIFYGGTYIDSDEPLDRVAMLDLHNVAMTTAADAAAEAVRLKEVRKVERADFTKHPDYQSTYDDPCLFSFVMASVIKQIGAKFTTDDTVLFDSAFLLAFLPAMAGLNKEQSCMNAMNLVWRK